MTSLGHPLSAVDWFILRPRLSGSHLSATVTAQGTVAVKDASLLYPYTAVNNHGVGYLLFSLSGRATSRARPTSDTRRTARPARSSRRPRAPPLTTASGCYPAFVGPFNGGCRWGDYSMGALMGGRVYRATEMIPQGFRDTLTNWGTFIWSAPPP